MTSRSANLPLFISSIAYCLGESAPISEIPEIDNELLNTFQALGLAQYSRSSEDPYTLALTACEETLRTATMSRKDIGCIVYATNTLSNSNHSRNDLRRLCCALELEHAFPAGVFSWECSNVYLAVTAAADALRSGRTEHVLVVTTDMCLAGESRILPPNLTVLSDGSSSFILSSAACGRSSFEIGGTGSFSDPGLSRVDPETQLWDFFHRTVNGLTNASNQALTNGALNIPDISAVVTNNYNMSIMRTFADKVGYDVKKAYCKNLPRFAHAYAADCLINLRDLDDSGGIASDSHCLLIASGPTAWGAITLTKKCA